MSFRRRPYPEVLDSLLTSLLGGVAAEAHPFPPAGEKSKPPFRHILCQTSVRQVFSVWGTVNGAAYLFKVDADYRLLDDKKSVEWSVKGKTPDAGTLVYINYCTESAASPVSDVHTGSVVRTITEAIGLEIAQLYANLEMVYQAGFIDTAADTSLDKVVALLGIERIRGGRPAGKARFTRAPASAGSITIPRGTRIMDKKGEVEYETIEAAEMAPQQNVLIVPIRDLEVNDPVGAETLVVLPKPIAGLGEVTNPGPTVIITRDETDEALRDRAKSFLHGSERATVGAIRAAIANQGVEAEIEENSDGPGTIGITLHGENLEPEVLERVYKAVYDARPAGVRPIFAGIKTPLRVDLAIELISDETRMKADIRTAHQQVLEKFQGYFASLAIKADASLNQLVSIALGVPGIKDMTVRAATVKKNDVKTDVLDKNSGRINLSGDPTVLGDLKIADGNLPTGVLVVITHQEGAALPDNQATSAALTQVVATINQEIDAIGPQDTPVTVGYDRLHDAVALPGGEAAASLYKVQFIITQSSGFSLIMATPDDAPYTPQAGERLVLEEVMIGPEE